MSTFHFPTANSTAASVCKLCVRRTELLPQSRSVFDDAAGKVRWAGVLPGLGRAHVASCPHGTTWDQPLSGCVWMPKAVTRRHSRLKATGELHKLQVRMSASFDCRHGPACIRTCLADDALAAFPHNDDHPALAVEWLQLEVKEGPPPTPSKM